MKRRRQKEPYENGRKINKVNHYDGEMRKTNEKVDTHGDV